MATLAVRQNHAQIALRASGHVVKLHAFKVKLGVFDGPDFIVWRPRGEAQLAGQGGALDGQRVVTVDRELRGQVGKPEPSASP
jgi:hypothetical protein